jgi:hypothetical protein
LSRTFPGLERRPAGPRCAHEREFVTAPAGGIITAFPQISGAQNPTSDKTFEPKLTVFMSGEELPRMARPAGRRSLRAIARGFRADATNYGQVPLAA